MPPASGRSLPRSGLQRSDRFFLIGRINVGEAFTASLLLSALHAPREPFAGVSGRLRIVAPVAFRTALAIAGGGRDHRRLADTNHPAFRLIL